MYKTVASVFLIIIFLLSLISCTDKNEIKSQAAVPVYSQNMSPDERAMAAQAFVVFLDACQPLMTKHLTDVESIDIESGFDRDRSVPGDGCLDYRCRDYGWDKQIYIKVKLKDKLYSIPPELKAWGHTLHFYLGGPNKPGITTSKIPELCGKENKDRGVDIYISETRLAFIK